jgi:hypothetical protein
MTIRDVLTVKRSPELEAEIEKVRAGFGTTAAARSFGPGAPSKTIQPDEGVALGHLIKGARSFRPLASG